MLITDDKEAIAQLFEDCNNSPATATDDDLTEIFYLSTLTHYILGHKITLVHCRHQAIIYKQ